MLLPCPPPTPYTQPISKRVTKCCHYSYVQIYTVELLDLYVEVLNFFEVGQCSLVLRMIQCCVKINMSQERKTYKILREQRNYCKYGMTYVPQNGNYNYNYNYPVWYSDIHTLQKHGESNSARRVVQNSPLTFQHDS